MKDRYRKIMVLVCLTVLIMTGSACTGSNPDNAEDILVRVGGRVLTPMDFKAAFEIAKSAYPHNEMQKPSELKTVQSRLLNQLTEELILLERARELDISVTESEVDAAVSAVKKDYPEGTFNETLLEYAVSFDMWRQRLKHRLLMEKVVEKELKDEVSITAKDVLSYHEANYLLKPHKEQGSENINKVMVEQLRRKKAEDAYRTWINKLQNRYSIHINMEQWEKIIGS
jgi:hypothetical protein